MPIDATLFIWSKMKTKNTVAASMKENRGCKPTKRASTKKHRTVLGDATREQPTKKHGDTTREQRTVLGDATPSPAKVPRVVTIEKRSKPVRVCENCGMEPCIISEHVDEMLEKVQEILCGGYINRSERREELYEFFVAAIRSTGVQVTPGIAECVRDQCHFQFSDSSCGGDSSSSESE